MNNCITNYEDYLQLSSNNPASLFYVIEYKNYDTADKRFSLMRNEILTHPQNFKERLNNGIYKIWVTTPIEIN